MDCKKELYRPPFFFEMRKRRGEICPRCGSAESIKKLKSFEQDNKTNDIWFCEDCQKKYSYVRMIK